MGGVGRGETAYSEPNALRLNYARFAALTAFVCAGFTASASWFLLAYYAIIGPVDPELSTWKLAVKGGVFTLIFVAAIAALFRLCRRSPLPPRDPVHSGAPTTTKTLFVASCVLPVILAAGARLDHHPHIEPDETHHLIVARNLGVHGVYGSGMPVTGFRRFDDYDSVGPTVILPVAAAFRVAGVDLGRARLVMVAFYAALTVAVCAFVADVLPPVHGAYAALFMFMAPGSLYLARTLYGEAPALLFLVLGATLCWRGVQRASFLRLVISGLLLGAAVVTKFIVILAVWPALGMLAYDALTVRCLRATHIAVPAVAAAAPIALWTAVTAAFGPPETQPGGLVAMYQHNLMFGVGSVGATVGWLADNWVATLLVVGGLLAAIPAVTANPPALFFVLYAAFNAYWWIFFTTGNIPRYLWFSLAIGACCAGAMCASWLTSVRRRSVRGRKVVFAACAIMVLVASLCDGLPRVRAAFVQDDMRDEYALVDRIRRDYLGKRIATTFYPVERILNLFAEQPVARVRTADAFADYDVVIVDAASQPELIPRATVQRLGRYAIVQPTGLP